MWEHLKNDKKEKENERANLVCADTGCGDKLSTCRDYFIEARDGDTGLRCPECYIVLSGRNRSISSQLTQVIHYSSVDLSLAPLKLAYPGLNALHPGSRRDT